MEPEGPLPCSQQQGSSSLPELETSGPKSYLTLHFNIILQSTPPFLKCSFVSGPTTKILNAFLSAPICVTFSCGHADKIQSKLSVGWNDDNKFRKTFHIEITTL